jgi:hypothetical protein
MLPKDLFATLVVLPPVMILMNRVFRNAFSEVDLSFVVIIIAHDTWSVRVAKELLIAPDPMWVFGA